MKLYATTTSERATKGQGGNEYLNIDILINDRQQPQFRTIVKHDKTTGQTAVLFQSFSFGKWVDSYKTILFENVKGNKQKGEKKLCNICSIEHAESGDLCEYCKNII